MGNKGKLGTVVSSQRFKGEIGPMDKASEMIHSIQPVTFQIVPPQFGLVTAKIEKVNPDVLARDKLKNTVGWEALQTKVTELEEILKEQSANWNA